MGGFNLVKSPLTFPTTPSTISRSTGTTTAMGSSTMLAGISVTSSRLQ